MDSGGRLLVAYGEAMCMLGDIGKTTFFGLIDTGDIERVKIGRRGFITVRSIEAYVERLSGVARGAELTAPQPVGSAR